MLVMPKPKKSKQTPVDEQKRGGPNRTGLPLYVYIPPELDGALQAYLEASSPRVSKTSAVEAALHAFLREKGFWPVKGGGK